MARGYKNITFKWNDKASVIIGNLGFGRELNKDAATILKQYSEPYVPFKTGNLNSAVRVSATDRGGTITYMAHDNLGRAYSKFQYTLDEGNADGNDERVMRTRTEHPLATSYWCYWAWTTWSREITDDIDEARLKYRKPTKPRS